jgi:hypothetical protein
LNRANALKSRQKSQRIITEGRSGSTYPPRRADMWVCPYETKCALCEPTENLMRLVTTQVSKSPSP